jgi:Tol biopolymer transport system component
MYFFLSRLRDSALFAIIALAAAAGAARADASSPYSTAPYSVGDHSYNFGQAPTFTPDGRIAVGKDFHQGDGMQVYLSALDGSARKCLTCDMPAPNNVPNPRPQGDWILFHSWNGHHITFGSPGYGGIGSEIWVMHPDGSHKTQLTGTDAAHGAGEGADDYHAYWSPDGHHLVWAHLNWNFITDGGQGKWDIREADFVNSGSGPPHLANERVVRPANGHFYETQWWAPDGSGFLYTETVGTAMDTQLFFCKLTADGCKVRQLTDTATWNEQALFTPDMKSVIFMSSRDHPGFFNTFASLAQAAGLTTSADYLLTLPVFEAAYFQPVAQEATDLYQLDLASGNVRRLTHDGDNGWIIPEIAWDPTNSYVLWTESRFPDGMRVPTPVDVQRQLEQENQFLSHPPTPDAGSIGPNNAVIPLEQRTRVLRFQLPAGPAETCPAPRRRLKIHLGRAVRSVKVLVDGALVISRHGKALRSVELRRPAKRQFELTVVERHADGTSTTRKRTYTRC